MSRHWVVLLPLLCGSLGNGLASGLVTVPAPRIAAELGMSVTARSWIVDIYPLALAVALIGSARLGARFGRRRMLLLGAALTLVFNAVAAASGAEWLLIACRAAAGEAGALVLANVVATIGARFEGRDLAIANGAWIAVVGTSSALGPVLGGVLTDTLGWRSVFLVLSAVAAATIVLAVVLMPESAADATVSFDAVSLTLSALAVGAVIYGVKRFTEAPAVSIAVLLVGSVALVVFARRQLRASDPLLDVALLRVRRLSVAAVYVLISAAGASACLYLVSVQLQEESGQSSLEAGIALVPLAVATTAGGVIAPLLLGRLSTIAVVRIAVLVQGAGLVGVGTGWLPLVLALACTGVGYGVVGTVATTALFEAATPARAAPAGVIQEVSFALGMGTGIAVFGSLASTPAIGFTAALVAAGLVTAATALLPTRPRSAGRG